MSPGERLKQLRESTGLSQAEFGDKLGFKHNKVRDLESGKQKITRDIALLVEEVFFAREWWLLLGEGEMLKKSLVPTRKDPAAAGDMPDAGFQIPAPSRRIPILSWAQAGTDGFFVDSHAVGQGFGDINCPYDVTDPNAYALIISGDSMAPKYEAGDIVVLSPAAGVQTGDYAVVRLADGQVMAKRIKEKDSVFILESINPGFSDIECPRESVITMHRIVWVKQRG